MTMLKMVKGWWRHRDVIRIDFLTCFPCSTSSSYNFTWKANINSFPSKDESMKILLKLQKLDVAVTWWWRHLFVHHFRRYICFICKVIASAFISNWFKQIKLWCSLNEYANIDDVIKRHDDVINWHDDVIGSIAKKNWFSLFSQLSLNSCSVEMFLHKF